MLRKLSKEIVKTRAVARLSTVGKVGQKGAIENFLILKKFAKLLENFQ